MPSEWLAWTTNLCLTRENPTRLDQKTLASEIVTLDLSRSLLATWSDVLLIAAQLPRLKTLVLNDNRLTPLRPDEVSNLPHFNTLEELRLNNCFISEDEIWTLGVLFPGLTSLEVGYNRLNSLNPPAGASIFQKLSTVNLATNDIEDWAIAVRAVRTMVGLRHLILSDNKIGDVPWPTSADLSRGPSLLRTISLASNRMRSWSSLDALAAWFPYLEGFYGQENPYLEAQPGTLECARQLTIARFPSLITCDGSPISPYERKDAELFYLTFIVKTVSNPDERASLHPQWPVLCAKHGAPVEAEVALRPENLGSRIIELGVHRLSEPPSREVRLGSLAGEGARVQIKVLPSMNLKTLRAKSLKALKIRPATAATVRLFALLAKDNTDDAVTIEMDCDGDGGKEIDFWGLENGSSVGVLVVD
ncbi:hypothetical protein M407DRAFT_127339 [Tulasnella calospora MUT 4182]|uniref:Uncharacterized protein n=1 Tax=Tulasnella calospora MUT 4182 TaxID=1051891 RepID=A0A0C3QWQ1_9AGAM|nr:hypothetical protein M407DRAFT_127339 [Tulasnella calospora MUT 4182]